MVLRSIKNSLLALSGVLQGIFAVVNLIMQDPDGSVALRKFAVESTVLFQAKFALAAGTCTIVAGLWSPRRGKSWLLVLNGLALSAYGLLPILWRGPLSFRPVSLLFVVMAMSIGILALATARTLRHHAAEEWLLGLAGVASVGFALAFFAMGHRWIKLDQPGLYFLWLSSFFGFSAICMLGLALRLNGVRVNTDLPGSVLPTG